MCIEAWTYVSIASTAVVHNFAYTTNYEILYECLEDPKP